MCILDILCICFGGGCLSFCRDVIDILLCKSAEGKLSNVDRTKKCLVPATLEEDGNTTSCLQNAAIGFICYIKAPATRLDSNLGSCSVSINSL